jgi:hypothetical protein
LHPVFLQQVQVAGLLARLTIAATEQHGHPGGQSDRLDALGDVGEERVGHVEHDQTEHATVATAQVTSGGVGHVPQIPDGGEDAAAGGGRHAVALVEHGGNGTDRDPGALGDITHSDRWRVGHGLLLRR